jgi:pSer/pThr/pTyr-binding forkhead associated (FHA) protein
MQAKLISRSAIGGAHELPIAQEATIGKDVANSIVLYEKNISKRHARIFFDAAENCYVLEDLNSRNGTKLDGERVFGKERLHDIHVITFGNRLDFFFQLVKDDGETLDSEIIETSPVAKNNDTALEPDFAVVQNPQTVFDDAFVETPEFLASLSQGASINSNPKKTTADSFLSEVEKQLASQKAIMTSEAANMPSAFTLSIEGMSQKYRLKQGQNIVGRSSRCDVAIKHETVSRRHACISVHNDIVRVYDLNSKNQTFVGRRQLLQAAEIRPRTLLRFGEVAAVLEIAPL